MPEDRELCIRFEDWLLEEPKQELAIDTWQPHLDDCASCREQLSTHQLLAAAFETEPVPHLSPAFERRLSDRIGAGARVQRLRGWRLAAMGAYVALAAAGLSWALRDVPLPSIDPASAWTAVIACALVPPTLALALFASRFLPNRLPGVSNSGSGFLLGL